MEKPIPYEDAVRIVSKGDRARKALSDVPKGGEDNVIDLTCVFEVKLWQNNRKQWKKVFDTKRKVK